MQHQQNIQLQSFSGRYRIEIIAKPITLELKRSFNTAHSSSTTRTNFLVKTVIKNQNISDSLTQKQTAPSHSVAIGYGQCGLPPKKPFCYLADIEDCQNFMKEILFGFEEFHQQLTLHLQQKSWVTSSFQKLFNEIFCQHQQSQVQENQSLWFFQDKFAKLTSDRTNQSNSTKQMQLYIQIFYLFSKAKQLSKKNYQFKAARNALQFSLLDLIGQIQGKSVSQIISGKQLRFLGKFLQNFSFYTISHQEDLQSMLQNGRESLQFTDCIKIKFNNNVQKLIELLILMDQQQIGRKWIIDANASWTPADYQKFQKLFDELAIKNDNIKSKVLFIEQPFPIFKSLIGFKTQQQILNEKKEWQKIKQDTSLLIVADESFASFQDLNEVLNYSHGINIKMEKCGGPLQAIKILRQVQKHKIENVMFGSMVSTHLGCTQTFQFHQYATYFDIDGSLLVKSPQIGGGFQWKGSEGIKRFHGNGLAMKKLDVQKLF